MPGARILVDAREFVPGRYTGIARVLDGLIEALCFCATIHEDIFLATHSADCIPSRLRSKNRIRIKEIPKSFIGAEKSLSDFSKETQIFISPYPKLPLFGVHCRTIHVIHDILDLTHPLYRKRFKAVFDRYRLRKALQRADVTWYDSYWSMTETQKFAGSIGKRPRVRYPGIDAAFSPDKSIDGAAALKKHNLEPGYVIVIGNGLPHKNLGVLLDLAGRISKKMVFVGVPDKNRRYWKSQYPNESARWISHVEAGDLPSLLRGAFCLAQPSTAEGYGYPPLEAMACGVPAVASDIPVLLETTGSIALYADPHNPKAWMEALSALKKDELYQAQIEKGLNWVESLKGAKGWHGHIADIEALFNERSECEESTYHGNYRSRR